MQALLCCDKDDHYRREASEGFTGEFTLSGPNHNTSASVRSNTDESGNFASYATKQLENQAVRKPTEEYNNFQSAYDHFNSELFGGRLTSCLFTLKSSPYAHGYFASFRFAARNNYTLRTHEIALNPDSFVGRDDKEILSTLVHEQTHLWQAHHGKPGRRGYHNRQWAREMLRIGLRPLSLDNPGKMTGQRVSHEIVPGGLFDIAADKLLATGFRLRWQSATEIVYAGTGKRTVETIEPIVQKRNKVKLTCPECGQNVWGSRSTRLICGNCTDTKVLKKYILLTWLTESRP